MSRIHEALKKAEQERAVNQAADGAAPVQSTAGGYRHAADQRRFCSGYFQASLRLLLRNRAL